MIYAIQASVIWVKDGWRNSKQIPTFFLDGDIQGICNVEHAEQIAKRMLEPTEDFTAHVIASEAIYLVSTNQ